MDTSTIYLADGEKGIQIQKKDFQGLFEKYPDFFSIVTLPKNDSVYAIAESDLNNAIEALWEKKGYITPNSSWGTIG